MSTSSTGHQPPGLVPSTYPGAREGIRPPVQRTDSPELSAGPPGPDPTAPSLPELRGLRREARREEADLSYLRRLLQGRIDILRAELDRRGRGPGPDPAPPGARAVEPDRTETAVVDRLAEILTDGPARYRSSARHVTLGTPRGEECRRMADEVFDEVGLSDLTALTGPELTSAMARLVRFEQQVSQRRRRVQGAADEWSAEIARRYRDGEARVEDLLG
ncbi:aerial mycelium formation protein [Streptomyces sp. ZYX-F-203]